MFAYNHELFSVGLQGLDELDHPTAAILSIAQEDEARKSYYVYIVCTCTGGLLLAPEYWTDEVLNMYA